MITYEWLVHYLHQITNSSGDWSRAEQIALTVNDSYQRRRVLWIIEKLQILGAPPCTDLDRPYVSVDSDWRLTWDFTTHDGKESSVFVDVHDNEVELGRMNSTNNWEYYTLPEPAVGAG